MHISFNILHRIWFEIPSGTLSGISNIYLAYFLLYPQTKFIGFYLVYFSVFFLIFYLVHCREFFRGPAVRKLASWGRAMRTRLRCSYPHWGSALGVIPGCGPALHIPLRSRQGWQKQSGHGPGGGRGKEKEDLGGRSTPLIKSDNTHPSGKKMSTLEFLQGRCPKTVYYW